MIGIFLVITGFFLALNTVLLIFFLHNSNKQFSIIRQELQSQAKNQQESLLNQLSAAHQAHLKQYQSTMEYLNNITLKINQQLNSLNEQLKKELVEYRQQFDNHQMKSLKTLQDSLGQGLSAVSKRSPLA